MNNMKIWIPTSLLGALLVWTGVLGQESPEVALRAAMETETVEGDLKSAIEQYERISESSDRVIVARALIRLAGCYEKLGVAESRKIYERVIRDYADQKEAASVARAKLSAADPAEPAKRDRVVWASADIFGYGRVSSDGRFLSDTDWNTTGALILYDLVSHTWRPLTEGWDGPGNAMASAFSPDGRQIAYSWMNYDTRRCEIRIVNASETGLPKARVIHKNEDTRFMGVTDWSSDGKWLAVRLQRRDNSGQIAVFGLQDRALRILKSVDWRGPEKLFFSPDSRYLAYDLPASDEEFQRDVFVIAVDASREERVVEHAAHDVMMGWSTDGRQLLFASDRTGSMGLWAVPVSDGKEQAAPGLLKPDVGYVHSVGLTASGALHVTKDASNQSLQVAPIDLRSGKLTGPPVVQAYRSARPSWSHDGKYLAFRSTGSGGEAILTIRSTETGEVQELRPTLNYFHEPFWMPDARSLMVGGRDFKGRDAVYEIEVETGKTSFVTASRLGRVQVSPDGKKLYFPSPDRPERRLMELNLESGETRALFEISGTEDYGSFEISPDGRYLATAKWNSEAKTSSVVVLSVADGQERELLSVGPPELFGAYGYMSWTPDGEALLVQKRRQSLGDPYGQDGRKELWVVPTSEGQARKLDIDIDDWTGRIRLHPNGKQIAFFTGDVSTELWAFENLLPERAASR
jgi:Tol biopolymer transport system component